MGIPGLFKYIYNKYKHNKNLTKKPNNVEYLLIDGNGFIHPVCFDVKKNAKLTTPINELEDTMIKEVIKYLEEIITIINPTSFVYLAIDGVAPAAKINHQRIRRYKSYQDSELLLKYKKKYNIPEEIQWSNAAITPGTAFMHKLHLAFLKWMNTHPLNIIYSSYLVPGEGEHKILNYIKTISNKCHCIYGLDADLIFLSLSSQLPNIFISRQLDDGLLYVSIDTYKELLLETIGTSDPRVIIDFVFLCFLLGNDFMPHSIAIDIYQNGIDVLINAYKDTILNKAYLVKKSYDINLDSFALLLNYLSDIEDSIIKSNSMTRTIRKEYFKTEYDRKIYELENMLFEINDPVNYGMGSFSEYRNRHYKYYYGSDNVSKELSLTYLNMLSWNLKYYFEQVPSWLDFYPYHTAPFFYDLHMHIGSYKIKPFEKTKPVDPILQLMLVVPPQLSYLLPKVYEDIIKDPNSEITYLYPENFTQDFINVKKHFLAKPLLPILNIELVKREYDKYISQLTAAEKARNKNTNKCKIKIHK